MGSIPVMEIVKLVCAIGVLIAGYFVNKWIQAWYQRWLDSKDKQAHEDATTRAAKDAEDLSNDLNGPRDGI